MLAIIYTIYKVNFTDSFYKDHCAKKFLLERIPQLGEKTSHSVAPAMGLNKPSASRQSARTSY